MRLKKSLLLVNIVIYRLFDLQDRKSSFILLIFELSLGSSANDLEVLYKVPVEIYDRDVPINNIF